MKSRFYSLRLKAIRLRSIGKSYGEIREATGTLIPKSTLSYWCKGVSLPKNYQERINEIVALSGHKGRAIAVEVNKIRRDKYLKGIFLHNKHLSKKFKDYDVARIALATLYICEGAKSMRSICFGNSSPGIIRLFLKLLRTCYDIDENKFSCTVQCRADQDVNNLKSFWSVATGIPLDKFKKTRIDPRTIGKPTLKKDYKGVCRIDYFSAHIYNELSIIGNILTSGK